MRSEYQSRIDRVIAHIDANLSEDLSLEQLARVACFSEYHFHRLFRGLVGESLNEFVRRRRLETAARSLHLNSNDKVIDVALNAGYENPASFFRAFRSFFGFSPSGWRKRGATEWTAKRVSLKNSLRTKNSKIGNVLGPETWEILRAKDCGAKGSDRVEIRDLPECRVVYRRYTGRYGNPSITMMWGELIDWAHTRGLLSMDSTFIGILHDDPNITAPEKCRYDACLVVDENFQDSDALIGHFRGGKYLTYDFVGTPSEVDPAWDRVYGEFVLSSGYLVDSRPNAEFYAPNSIIDPERMIFRSKLGVSVRVF
jgi:AraC family transcriptional regulator